MYVKVLELVEPRRCKTFFDVCSNIVHSDVGQSDMVYMGTCLFYEPHFAWCTIIQIDFQKLWSRLQYTPVPLIPSSTCSCIDACLYTSWHTIHKFIKTLLAQIVPLLNSDLAYISQIGWWVNSSINSQFLYIPGTFDRIHVWRTCWLS